MASLGPFPHVLVLDESCALSLSLPRQLVPLAWRGGWGGMRRMGPTLPTAWPLRGGGALQLHPPPGKTGVPHHYGRSACSRHPPPPHSAQTTELGQ